MTENLAFPLATTALVFATIALSDPAPRWRWLAIGFAIVGTFARAQVGVLFAVFLLGLLLTAASAEDPRARLRQEQTALIALGVLVAAGVAVVMSGSVDLLGNYSTVSDLRPSAGDTLSFAGQQWLALAVMSGIVPLAALLVLGAQGAARRDSALGPLIAMSGAAVIVFVLESGYFNAGYPGLDWSIERYIQYPIPLLLVLLFAAIERGRLPFVWLGAASAGVTATLLLSPDVRQAVEQRAIYASEKLVDGVTGIGTAPALVLGALLVSGTATLLVARLPPARAVLAVGVLLLLTFVVQAQWAWRWQIDFTKQVRAQYPASLTWVDDHAKGPVSRLYLYQNSYLFERIALFNDSVQQLLSPTRLGPERPPLGARQCPWTVDERGTVSTDPACGAIRRRIWNDDAYIQMSFHGGRELARDAFLGQIIAVPPNPRLRSVIRMPCQRATLVLGKDNTPRGIPKKLECPPNMSVFLWNDAPGTLELTFKGGSREQSVAYGGKTYPIPARTTTRVRVPVKQNVANLTLKTGWDRTVGTELVNAQFISANERAPLL